MAAAASETLWTAEHSTPTVLMRSEPMLRFAGASHLLSVAQGLHRDANEIDSVALAVSRGRDADSRLVVLLSGLTQIAIVSDALLQELSPGQSLIRLAQSVKQRNPYHEPMLNDLALNWAFSEAEHKPIRVQPDCGRFVIGCALSLASRTALAMERAGHELRLDQLGILTLATMQAAAEATAPGPEVG